MEICYIFISQMSLICGKRLNLNASSSMPRFHWMTCENHMGLVCRTSCVTPTSVSDACVCECQCVLVCSFARGVCGCERKKQWENGISTLILRLFPRAGPLSPYLSHVASGTPFNHLFCFRQTETCQTVPEKWAKARSTRTDPWK